jgi:hypothetical protein
MDLMRCFGSHRYRSICCQTTRGDTRTSKSPLACIIPNPMRPISISTFMCDDLSRRSSMRVRTTAT